MESALKYAELGYSVIPVGKDKKPYVKWEPYQRQKADKQQIQEWWGKYPEAGVAIVTGSISGLSVVDIDTKEGEQAFRDKVGDVVCPIAISPRGGKHLYFQDMGCGNKTGVLPGVDFRGEGGYIIAPPSPGSNGKRYAWVKGKRITELPPPPAAASLLGIIKNISIYSLYSNIEGNIESVNAELQNVTMRYMNFNHGTRDESLFHVANSLAKGGMPKQEIEELLRLICTRVCQPPEEESVVPVKIKSAMDRLVRKERNVSQEVRDIIALHQGNISVTYLAKELQCVTKEERGRLRVAVHRLANVEGLLEPTKRVAGEYRIVNKEYDVVNLMEIGQGNVADVKLPFEIEKLVDIYPKDLIVFAGAPNAGKTALMLETVRLNMDKWKCWYFSTEMGRFNARDRLAKHETCKDWNFKFIDNVPNYLDILHPDDMNFIDYVETDAEGNYYKIAGVLGAIQKRMQNGIVFVALQKKTGANFALGGEQTKAKASLFCSIDADYPGAIARLEKVKNFKGTNPNGFTRKFSIRGGINVEAKGMWQPEY